jgi:hypothetical protein
MLYYSLADSTIFAAEGETFDQHINYAVAIYKSLGNEVWHNMHKVGICVSGISDKVSLIKNQLEKQKEGGGGIRKRKGPHEDMRPPLPCCHIQSSQ